MSLYKAREQPAVGGRMGQEGVLEEVVLKLLFER
jgi:hypothetical protein